MGFVGLDVDIGNAETGGKWSADQYVSGLPKELWNPEGWGDYKEGFVEELRRSQHRILEKRQKKAEEDAARGVPRTGLAFVGEKGTEFGMGGNRKGESGVGGRGGSAAERVMEGLDRSGRDRDSPAGRGGGENGRRGGGGREGYDRDRDRRDRGGGDAQYRNRERDKERERDRERDRRKYNRSRSRSRSRDRERYRR